jgi:predicted methyltransferase
MKNELIIKEAVKGLGQKQKSIIKLLSQSSLSLPSAFLDFSNTPLYKLRNRGLVVIQAKEASLTDLGKEVIEYLWNHERSVDSNYTKLY